MVYVLAKSRFSSDIACHQEEIQATKLISLFLIVVMVSGVTEILLFDVVPHLLHHHVM